MKGNFLKICNNVQFSLVGQDMSKIQDDFIPHGGQQFTRTVTGGLHVKIAATHAGIITRNNGFYLPDRMKSGVTSFTDNYNKPVLLHHDDDADPIGRIIHSAYIDTSGPVRDKYDGKVILDSTNKEIGVITAKLIDDFTSGKMPFGQQIDVIRTLLRDSLLEDKSYRGLGYIEIVADISDQESIQKLLDGRYITGSVGATTNKAICSVCKQDWTEDGQCEHKPGGLYDSVKCFIITGDLLYDEYSFVNIPADRHSKVLELHYNGITDNIETVDEFQSRLYEVQLSFPQYASTDKENYVMGDNTNTDVKAADPATGSATKDTKDNTVVDKKIKDKVDDSAKKTKVADKVSKDTKATEAAKQTKEETIEDFVTRVVDADSISVEDEEKLYSALWAEAESAVKDGTLKIDSSLLADAKLSTEQRKKLAKSTFCGPNRSFPVSDCAHVVAARRLVSKAKIEDATKTKILESVSRKAKAMGCEDSIVPNADNSMNDGVSRIMHMILNTIEEDTIYSSDDSALESEEMDTLRGILKRLAGVVGKDNLITAAISEGLSLDPTSEQTLVDEVEKQEDLVGNLRDQLTSLRKEYSALFQDMDSMQDGFIAEKSDTRKLVEDYASVLQTLASQKSVEGSTYVEFSDTALLTEVERLVGEVDMNKIADKLGDGMTRVPQGSVDDPNVVQDNTGNTQTYSDEVMQKIQEKHLKILLTDGVQAAQIYIERTRNSLTSNKS